MDPERIVQDMDPRSGRRHPKAQVSSTAASSPQPLLPPLPRPHSHLQGPRLCSAACWPWDCLLQGWAAGPWCCRVGRRGGCRWGVQVLAGHLRAGRPHSTTQVVLLQLLQPLQLLHQHGSFRAAATAAAAAAPAWFF